MRNFNQYNVIDLSLVVPENFPLFLYLRKTISYFFKITFYKFKKEDVIIETNILTFIPLFSLSFKKAKHIHVVHDLFMYSDESTFKFRFKILGKILYIYRLTINRLLYKITFRNATIVTISNATKNELINRFGKKIENRVRIISNGIDLKTFVPRTLKSFDLPKNYILYIGNEYERKNLKNQIKAFALIKQKIKDLVFIKSPYQVGESRQKTISHIMENNLEIGKDFIFLNEYLTHEQCSELYSNARLFMFPSLAEGFGFPIIEAMSCGCPVITSNYGPMNELIPYNDLTVNPNDPEDIANKMMKILEDDDLRKKIIKEGQEFSRKFSWENTAMNFINLINNK